MNVALFDGEERADPGLEDAGDFVAMVIFLLLGDRATFVGDLAAFAGDLAAFDGDLSTVDFAAVGDDFGFAFVGEETADMMINRCERR